MVALILPGGPGSAGQTRQTRELDLVDTVVMHPNTARKHRVLGPGRDHDTQVGWLVVDTYHTHGVLCVSGLNGG